MDYSYHVCRNFLHDNEVFQIFKLIYVFRIVRMIFWDSFSFRIVKFAIEIPVTVYPVSFWNLYFYSPVCKTVISVIKEFSVELSTICSITFWPPFVMGGIKFDVDFPFISNDCICILHKGNVGIAFPITVKEKENKTYT